MRMRKLRVLAGLLLALSFVFSSRFHAFAEPPAQTFDDKSQSLIYATAEGNLPEMRRLLDQEPRLVNSLGHRGEIALFWAGQADQKAAAELLLARGAKVNASVYESVSPLFGAAFNSAAVMQLLLDKKPNVNQADRFGRTALSHAVLWNNLDAARLLLRHGGKFVYNPFLTAVAAGDADRVKSVLAKNPRLVNAPNPDPVTPLGQAVLWGRPEIVALLLRHGAAPDAPNARGSRKIDPAFNQYHSLIPHLDASIITETPLLASIRLHRPDLAALLLDAGANPNLLSSLGGPPLAEAVRAHDLTLARVLMAHGADVNGDDSAALFGAVTSGDIEMFDLLVSKGANVKVTWSGGRTLLHEAAHANSLPLVTRLLKRGLDVNAEDGSKRTPLDEIVIRDPWNNERGEPGPSAFGPVAVFLRKHGGWDEGGQTPPLFYFVRMQDVEATKALLTKHPEFARAKDLAGHSPLFYTDYFADQRPPFAPMVALLAAHGVDVNATFSNGVTLLHYAVSKNDMAWVRDLVARGANVNADGPGTGTPLAWTLHNLPIAAFLLEHGADPNRAAPYGGTPLQVAYQQGAEDTRDFMDLLRLHGARENKFTLDIWGLPGLVRGTATKPADPTAIRLFSAVRHGQNDWFAELLRAHPDHVNARDSLGNTLLNYAINRNASVIARHLMARGANVNAADEQGFQPLHRAALLGDLPLCRRLLAHGADVNVKSRGGTTVLEEAVYIRSAPLVAFLLAHGADVNRRVKPDEVSPLHAAAMNGDVAVAKLLLARGAHVNARDRSADTPLHWAGMASGPEVAALLLNAGAAINARNERGETPLGSALRHQHEAVAAFLRARGGVE